MRALPRASPAAVPTRLASGQRSLSSTWASGGRGVAGARAVHRYVERFASVPREAD
ncbi:hypothetical protein [Pseudofrankia sp. EUN1h]|uniref:hypothetical protein n=1 Tax=Pseudofrankia sp. EUN1h TaxID=1834515 RepID=UPI00031AA143|nr:hypothetical protein [Pseudofrankia sp. EUN1h]